MAQPASPDMAPECPMAKGFTLTSNRNDNGSGNGQRCLVGGGWDRLGKSDFLKICILYRPEINICKAFLWVIVLRKLFDA